MQHWRKARALVTRKKEEEAGATEASPKRLTEKAIRAMEREARANLPTRAQVGRAA